MRGCAGRSPPAGPWAGRCARPRSGRCRYKARRPRAGCRHRRACCGSTAPRKSRRSSLSLACGLWSDGRCIVGRRSHDQRQRQSEPDRQRQDRPERAVDRSVCPSHRTPRDLRQRASTNGQSAAAPGKMRTARADRHRRALHPGHAEDHEGERSREAQRDIKGEAAKQDRRNGMHVDWPPVRENRPQCGSKQGLAPAALFTFTTISDCRTAPFVACSRPCGRSEFHRVDSRPTNPHSATSRLNDAFATPCRNCLCGQPPDRDLCLRPAVAVVEPR